MEMFRSLIEMYISGRSTSACKYLPKKFVRPASFWLQFQLMFFFSIHTFLNENALTGKSFLEHCREILFQ